MNKLVAILFALCALTAVGCSSTHETRAYDECSIGSTNQCEFGTGCFTISVGGLAAGMCTATCSSSNDCPIDVRGYTGECISFGGGAFTCFEGCISNADCAAGWSCRSSAGGEVFPPICLPD